MTQEPKELEVSTYERRSPLNGRTALAYIRVSVVGDRAKRGRFESPDLQRAAIDAWCQARGIEVVDEIRDLNRSGGHLTRPGLEQAMGLVPTLADGIVVARGDRASRRALDGLGLLDQLEKAGGWIAAADGTIDTSTRTAKMATTMHFAMAENELERYRETSAVVHERAIVDKGRHMGGTPFGYRRDADKRLVIHTPEAQWVRWIFEQRADGRGWASMSRELTERAVRQGTGRKLTHHMLRRMVTHRVYLGVAYHGKHVHPDAHPALIDPVLFEAANRVLPGAPPPRAGRVNVIGGLPGALGARTSSSRSSPAPATIAGSAARCWPSSPPRYECPAPARIRGSEHDTLKRLVVDAAKEFAASVGVETADDQRFEAAQRARVDAEHVLDDVSTLKMRKTLGPERWDKLLREASASLEAAKIEETRAQTHKRVNRRVWLSDAFDHLRRNSSAASYAPWSAASWSRPARGRSPTAFTSSSPTTRSSCPGRASPASPVAGLQRTGRQFPRKRRSNRYLSACDLTARSRGAQAQ